MFVPCFGCALRCVICGFVIILMGKRDLVALYCLYSRCVVIFIIMWPFLEVSSV